MKRRLIRPLWNIGITWLVVCLAGAWLPAQWLWLAAALLLLGFATAVLIPALRRNHVALLVLATSALATATLSYWETVRYQPIAAQAGNEVILCVQVSTVEDIKTVTVLSGDLPAGTELQLWGDPTAAALEPYDIVETAFTLNGLENTGLSLLQQKAGGVWLSATPVDMSAESWSIKDGDPPVTDLSHYGEQLALQMQGLLSGDVGGVVTGICLGADQTLSNEAVLDFRACGVSHLFAVSGLHLSILTQALLGLLKRLRVPRHIRGAISAVAVVAFSSLIGWTSSVTRAGVMCLLVIAGDSLRRQADARNSLGAALVLLLAAEPFAAYDVGLLLSFAATFGLLFLSPAIKQELVKLPLSGKLAAAWDYIAGMIAVTVAATLATLAIAVIFFGHISLVSVIANVAMTIPSSALLVVGWLAVLLMAAGVSVLYRPLLLVAGWLAKLLLWIARGLAQIPWATASVTALHLTVWVLGSLSLLAVGYWLFHRRGVRLALVMSVVILCIGVALQHRMLQDVVRIRAVPDDADAAMCVLYEDQAILVVSPTDIETLYAARAVLQEAGVSSLDALFIPSGEVLAVSYIPAVLEEYITAAAVYLPADETVALWDNAFAAWQEDGLYLHFGDVCVAVDTKEYTDGVDCIFRAGEMTVYSSEAIPRPYCITPQNGELPLLYIRDGVLTIK